MGGMDWPGDSTEEWPEAFGFKDFAKGVLMPHTAALSLADKIIDRGRGGRGGTVVQHTQPPPVAQSAREVQGQLTGLLKTVKGVEEKLDDTTRRLALLQSASSGNQDAERFQQSLSSTVLAVAPLLEERNWLGATAHIVPVVQNGRGIGAAIATKPISTFLFPLAALGIYASRRPRPPVIIASTTKTTGEVRVTIISPDGGDIRFESDNTAKAKATQVTKDSQRYKDPIIIAAASTQTVTARTYLFLRGSEEATLEFKP